MSYADDDLIEHLAAGQRGLVTRAQLRAQGISAQTIAGRVRANRLRPLHRGVYRVGPVVAAYARELAAVLANGSHAVLSHTSAGWLWQLLPDPGDQAPVDVTLLKGDRNRHRNIHIHRMCLQPVDVTTRENIPVTTPHRTLIDLAGVLASRDLEQTLARAERMSLLERSDLLSIVAKHAGRPGMPLLRMLLRNEVAPAFTRSEAEERLLALIRKAQLPMPETNVRVDGYEVDFFWRRERLVLEVDGFAFHTGSRTFENDRRRDATLAANGVRVLRVTWRQLTREPEATIVRLAQTLVRIALPPALHASA